MRICFVTTGEYRALPAMKRAIGMAPFLRQAGHRVAIVALDTPDNRERLERDAGDTELLYFTGGTVLAEVQEKRELLRTWSPDLLYLCGFGARNTVSFGLRCRVLVEHCELGSATVGLSFARRQLERVLEFASVLAADGMVCASRYLETVYAGRMARVFRKRPILYAPYAYSAVEETRRIPKAMSDGRRDIVYLGSLRTNYGLLDMVRAMSTLARTVPDARLCLLGAGPDEAEARRLTEQLGLESFVHFAGYVSEADVRAWLGQAAVFLAPLYDTPQDWARCPSKIYMYLPYETPIATCKIGDAAELLGDDGFYFASGNPKSLADAVACALASDDWTPTHVNIQAHSWEARTRTFLQWVDAAF